MTVTTSTDAQAGFLKRFALRAEVEEFLYEEAALLDAWRLHEWVELFAPSGRYLIPSTDLPDGDPSRDLFLVQDDRFLLEQRVNSLLTRSAHAEYPHSTTRRLIGNVRAERADSDTVTVAANFAVYRSRNAIFDTYVGEYRHVLRREAGGLRFEVRKVILAHDALRPQGKISIIL